MKTLYKQGSVFEIGEDGIMYVLALIHVDYSQHRETKKLCYFFNLISLEDGNRWNDDPILVESADDDVEVMVDEDVLCEEAGLGEEGYGLRYVGHIKELFNCCVDHFVFREVQS